ncbi:MAG: SpoIIE family protein phosphatase, partial [Merismopedia sp. SIO2A8]|nr:SpoIIE family protein phosphatase [Merismopedia sp. SIO2A8]
FHNNIFHQATLNLLGKAPIPSHLYGAIFNDARFEEFKRHQQEKTGLFHGCFCRLLLAYLFEEYDEAVRHAVEAEHYIDAAAGLFEIAPFHLYDSLAHLALYTHAHPQEQGRIKQRVMANRAKLHQWATHAPANHQHKYELVEAEWCRVQGLPADAMTHYEEAIASAQTHGYLNEEALACELAAKFYLDWGKTKIGQVFLHDAYECYTRWGAAAKVSHLESRYPSILMPVSIDTELSSGSQTLSPSRKTSIGTQSSLSSSLDVSTVVKVSQAISGEIVLDNLLEKLMQFAIENAGAERGALMLVTPRGLMIEALGTIDQIDVALSQPLIPIHTDEKETIQNPKSKTPSVAMPDRAINPKSSDIAAQTPIPNPLPCAVPPVPLSVVQYVQRTQNAIVLADATQDSRFTTDPYVVRSQPKSLLCTPILDRGKLLGLVYLENNLTTGAFSRDRLELLTLIASQAAIALENALLYRTLEDKVAERTAQLAEANQEITALNQRLEAENTRLSAELEITQRLQQMILPKPTELENVADLDIAGFMAPADEVGGDYYDVLQGHSGHGIKIGIGDVTGHGLESGVLMLMVQTAVRTLQESQEADPVRFLDIINRTLYKNIERMGTDKNLSLALLDYANGQLRLSGQHEELLIVRAQGEIERFDTIDLGFPIGLDTDIAEFIAQETIYLNVGDVAILYTDGITEAENVDRELYGIERLCQVVSQHWHCSAADIRQTVIADVNTHIGSQTVFDDITLVVLKRN